MGKHHLCETVHYKNYKVPAFPSWLSESLTRPIFSPPLSKCYPLGSAKTFWHMSQFHPLLHSCSISPRKAAPFPIFPISCEQVFFQYQWLLRDSSWNIQASLFASIYATSHFGTVQHLFLCFSSFLEDLNSILTSSMKLLSIPVLGHSFDLNRPLPWTRLGPCFIHLKEWVLFSKSGKGKVVVLLPPTQSLPEGL